MRLKYKTEEEAMIGIQERLSRNPRTIYLIRYFTMPGEEWSVNDISNDGETQGFRLAVSGSDHMQKMTVKRPSGWLAVTIGHWRPGDKAFTRHERGLINIHGNHPESQSDTPAKRKRLNDRERLDLAIKEFLPIADKYGVYMERLPRRAAIRVVPDSDICRERQRQNPDAPYTATQLAQEVSELLAPAILRDSDESKAIIALKKQTYEEWIAKMHEILKSRPSFKNWRDGTLELYEAVLPVIEEIKAILSARVTGK